MPGKQCGIPLRLKNKIPDPTFNFPTAIIKLPMRITTLLLVALIILQSSCKKRIETDSCDRRVITSYRVNSVGGHTYDYDEDEAMAEYTPFNNGQLLLLVGSSDTTSFDDKGRLSSYKLPFESSGRQTRYYYYDDQDRVVRTLTHTGNGIDYMANLVYENGDVKEMSYSIDLGKPDTSKFKFTYYDTPCVNPYFALKYWGQIGSTLNKHLVRTMIDYHGDSTHYSYVLDDQNRVMIAYRNYDNSAWTYSRETDTTWFTYSCR